MRQQATGVLGAVDARDRSDDAIARVPITVKLGMGARPGLGKRR